MFDFLNNMYVFYCKETETFTFLGLQSPDSFLGNSQIAYKIIKSFSAFNRGFFIFGVKECPEILEIIHQKKLVIREHKDQDQVDIDFATDTVKVTTS